jgi:ABC-type antimicrobial peptide transport system permease subunit
MRSMDEVLADSVSTPRAVMWLFLSFAGLALSLGVIGIYSVMSYSVAQRTREIGIRMAMGAGRWHVLRIVLRQGALMAASGVIVGVVCGMALTRFMRSLLLWCSPG